MSEPFEEEMLRRARSLVETRGEREIRVDKAYDIPYLALKAGRLSLAIREGSDHVEVSLKFEDRLGSWCIYHVDDWRDQDSIYKPEHYEECVELMKPLMILDDLADV